ncbi:ABC-type transport system substrate-binding protein [Paucibacter oligotrophus]|uniref:ABC-type transport system substrate-binding protein n=1 Tax=Roseateles oligotrophus TaxID=1769250 RepID=A0A840L8T2_9BURK|nr:ABC transporter substrate-binding protein [Roseateles oligotrophus]MBB4842549.1 ABC-type transport system substrate-binding protein [Roseateles oligotrophus]
MKKKTPILSRLLLPLSLALLLTLPVQAAEPAAATSAPKVLRYAFRAAETSFDPTQLTDIYSRVITAHVFETLYAYDHLARPIQIHPLIAQALPEISPDFKTFTIRLRPGIFFAADPAFQGRPRELSARDFVYSFKRFADPRNKSPNWAAFEEAGLLGLAELRQQAIKSGKAFDYAHEIPGLRALDRYTLQLRTAQPRPRLPELILTGNDLYGAVAREVVEFYGDKIGEHPVGTGPFVLKSWRRSSQIVLERNPAYRERYYDAQPAADDAEGQALLARFKQRRLPMVDRVEVAIIEEQQPRWLSFLNGEHDYLEQLPEDFINQAMPGGHLAPNLAMKGMRAFQTVGSDVTLTAFNMEDPLVGGYAPAQVALRRAISLALDIPREILLVRRGQALQAQSNIAPYTTGYSASFKSDMASHDLARAKALLDMYGYLDRDGDGWRERPDGSPLILLRNSQSDSQYRQLDEQWQKAMNDLGLRLEIKIAKWPENLKAARAGRFMSWSVGSRASQLDGQNALQRLYGPASGGQNLARFNQPEFNRIYEQMQGMADGPEREALFLQAKRIAAAYLPYKPHVHRLYTDLGQSWLLGYRRPVFWLDFWQYVDIDHSKRP